jgi:hypothetical protein
MGNLEYALGKEGGGGGVGVNRLPRHNGSGYLAAR